jgi:AcrR family transcriptional regulator
MTTHPRKTERRTEALSKDRIVEAAIAILDAEGDAALTFRALSARLETGSGALYWHVADKTALMAAAADAVIDKALSEAVSGAASDPRAAIRALVLGVFDVIEARPWVGAQISREPWSSAALQILEGVGGRLDALGVPEAAQFNAATALLNFILGVAGQSSAAARLDPRIGDRSDFLAAVAAQWTRRDPARYPFLHRIAAQLAGHDDRAQFLAGIDFILSGIEGLRKEPSLP